MLLLRTDRLPEGVTWQYEIKLDGYRAIAFKSGARVRLRSRNDKEFGGKYPAIVKALSALPAETVIEGGGCCTGRNGSDATLPCQPW
jgi:ATP-dependent DNA ligase